MPARGGSANAVSYDTSSMSSGGTGDVLIYRHGQPWVLAEWGVRNGYSVSLSANDVFSISGVKYLSPTHSGSALQDDWKAGNIFVTDDGVYRITNDGTNNAAELVLRATVNRDAALTGDVAGTPLAVANPFTAADEQKLNSLRYDGRTGWQATVTSGDSTHPARGGNRHQQGLRGRAGGRYRQRLRQHHR